MHNIFYVLISLCLASCVSKKDESNRNATPIVYDREDAGSLIVTENDRFSSSKALPEIKSAKGYKAPLADNVTAPQLSTISDKKAKYAAEREIERNKHIDPRARHLKSRHEKMMQQTSPVFANPTDVDSMRRRANNVKK